MIKYPECSLDKDAKLDGIGGHRRASDCLKLREVSMYVTTDRLEGTWCFCDERG